MSTRADINGTAVAHSLLPVAACTITALATRPLSLNGRRLHSKDRHRKQTGAMGNRTVPHRSQTWRQKCPSATLAQNAADSGCWSGRPYG